MRKKDPRVDAYIAKSADFAQPILRHLREIVYEGCPEVEETMKWSSPHFMYKGMLCGMAAFKSHCAFGFWKGKLIVPEKPEAMGQFGRIASLSDLPRDGVLLGYVMEAARLNETGEKVPRKPPQPKKLLATPPDLAAALKKNAKARATFQGFQPQPQEGIRRVDHRCQDGGDPQEAAPYRSRVDGRGQASELEIHALKRAASVALTGLEE
jgi:uncharacterized protein YdeI (YjbR/CyaY-like superfamily)